MSSSLWPHGLQHTRLPCPSPIPRVCSNSCPLSWWCHPTISFSVAPFSSWLQSSPASGIFTNESALCIRWPKVGALASVLPVTIKGWFALGSTGWFACSLRSSQESSPAPQFESINSSVFSLLYIQSSVHDYWKNHNFDSMDLCWQSDVIAF